MARHMEYGHRRLSLSAAAVLCLAVVGSWLAVQPPAQAARKWTSCAHPYVRHAFIGGANGSHTDIKFHESSVPAGGDQVTTTWEFEVGRNMAICRATYKRGGSTFRVAMKPGSRHGHVSVTFNTRTDQDVMDAFYVTVAARYLR